MPDNDKVKSWIKESWDASTHPLVTVEEMVNYIKRVGGERAVITGGEPLMYDLTELTTALRKENIKTFLETSGAYPLSGKYDWVCVSPKKFKPMIPGTLSSADELKAAIGEAICITVYVAPDISVSVENKKADLARTKPLFDGRDDLLVEGRALDESDALK